MATAAAQLDQLLATTIDNWRKTLSDQTVKRSSVYAALESKSRVTEQGGNEIRQPLLYALNDTVKFYSGYDLFDTTPQGGLGTALFPWRQLAGTVTISGEERRKNSGPEAFISLVETKFKQLEASFIRKFNEAMFAAMPAAGARDFNSLLEIVSDADPTRGALGGLEVATETWWKSKVDTTAYTLDGATFAAAVKALGSIANTLWVQGSMPDFEFTTQALFESYEAGLVGQIRYEGGGIGDAGFRTLAHRGTEIVFDPFVPADSWYFINSDFLEFVRHSAAWMTRLDTQRPYNQDAVTTPIICMGNLVTGLRRGHGVATDVSAS